MWSEGRLACATISIIVIGCASVPTQVIAQDCAELRGRRIAQGQLYALFGNNNAQTIEQVFPFPAINEFDFYTRIRLVYVLDASAPGPFGMRVERNFAGVIVARLVSTGSDTNRPLRPPAYVNVQRDDVTTRGLPRKALSRREVSAARYYVYHHPHGRRASDSFLEREFHTEYTSRDNEPDRRTYEPQERRSQFHFPEMQETESSDATTRVLSRVFGSGTALAAVSETRFEAQIKYYRNAQAPRCVTIVTQVRPDDDGGLNLTLTDLDHPAGITSPWATERWVIAWKRQARSGAR